jgi:cell division septal protein FtsQ
MFFEWLPLAQLEDPSIRMRLIGLTAVLVMLGLGIFGMLIQRELSGSPRWVKWLGTLPIVIAIVNGVMNVMKLNDQVYIAFQNIGDGMANLHRLTLIVPVLALIGCVVWGLLFDRRRISDM